MEIKNSTNEILSSKISAQKELLLSIISQLDTFNNKLDELIQAKNLEKNLNKISPKDRASLFWAANYGIYTNYYLYLYLNDKDPKLHEVDNEIKRLQLFRSKILEAEKEKKTKNRGKKG